MNIRFILKIRYRPRIREVFANTQLCLLIISYNPFVTIILHVATDFLSCFWLFLSFLTVQTNFRHRNELIKNILWNNIYFDSSAC